MSNRKIKPLQLEVVTDYLDPILVRQGFAFYLHEYYVQSFDTGLCIYGYAQESIRILWDGKDYLLILQYSATDLELNDWRDIKWHDIAVERIGRNPVSTDHLERLKGTLLKVIES